MTDIAGAYGAPAALTITLNSLASAASRSSAAVDFSSLTPIPLDVLVTVKVKTAGTLVAPASLAVFGYGTADGGATYTDGVGGADAAFVPTSPGNLKPLGTLNAPVTGTTYIGGPWSLAAAFGGTLPQKAGIVVTNNTGAALDSTAGNFSVSYTPVYVTN